MNHVSNRIVSFFACFVRILVLAVASLPGRARPREKSISFHGRGISSSPLWSSLAIRSIFLWKYVSPFFPLFSPSLLFFYFFSFFLSLLIFLSFNISGSLAYMCCAGHRIQYDGIALPCVLSLQHWDVVSVSWFYDRRGWLSNNGLCWMSKGSYTSA